MTKIEKSPDPEEVERSISVVVNDSDIIKTHSAALGEIFIIDKLREAGVPVIGLFSYGGVERGTLEIERNFEEHTHIFKWTPCYEEEST